MPMLSIFVSDDTMKRLVVFSKDNDRAIDDLASAAVENAAINAIPCIDGKPIDSRLTKSWEAV